MKNQKSQERELNVLIQPILQKYEKLGLINSPLYLQLKQCLKDTSWQLSICEVLRRVEDAKFIFGIGKEITKQKGKWRKMGRKMGTEENGDVSEFFKNQSILDKAFKGELVK